MAFMVLRETRQQESVIFLRHEAPHVADNHHIRVKAPLPPQTVAPRRIISERGCVDGVGQHRDAPRLDRFFSKHPDRRLLAARHPVRGKPSRRRAEHQLEQRPRLFLRRSRAVIVADAHGHIGAPRRIQHRQVERVHMRVHNGIMIFAKQRRQRTHPRGRVPGGRHDKIARPAVDHLLRRRQLGVLVDEIIKLNPFRIHGTIIVIDHRFHARCRKLADHLRHAHAASPHFSALSL